MADVTEFVALLLALTFLPLLTGTLASVLTKDSQRRARQRREVAHTLRRLDRVALATDRALQQAARDWQRL